MDVKPLPPVAPDSGYYATTAIAGLAIRHLKDHQDEHANEPFFQFIAFTSPHFPLQALAADIARYRDTYRRGFWPGRSLVPAFGADLTVRRESLWWLHEGNRAIRVGDHKLVTARSDGRWALYDLARDRAESKDLASQMPHRVRELARLWLAQATRFAKDADYGFDAPH